MPAWRSPRESQDSRKEGDRSQEQTAVDHQVDKAGEITTKPELGPSEDTEISQTLTNPRSKYLRDGTQGAPGGALPKSLPSAKVEVDEQPETPAPQGRHQNAATRVQKRAVPVTGRRAATRTGRSIRMPGSLEKLRKSVGTECGRGNQQV